MFYTPNISLSFPSLIFDISILLFPFVSVSAGTYILCHLLLRSVYFNSYLTITWNQQLIHSCWLCYIAISNMQQPYISLCVSYGTKGLQYTLRTISYSQWRTERCSWGFQPHSNLTPAFRRFTKPEPKSQFRGKYIPNNLIIIIRVSLICNLSRIPG
jgi:hypothetical protein